MLNVAALWSQAMIFKKYKSSDPDTLMFSACALQELVRSFGDGVDLASNAALFQGQFIARPALLTLAMELALKAWWVKEDKNREMPRTHDLLKLFDGLNKATQIALENAHPEIPSSLGFRPIRHGLRSLLESNKAAFVEWIYVHELSRANFPIGEFNEALSSVIREFDRAGR